jgi:uncharacterized protein with PIN domain
LVRDDDRLDVQPAIQRGDRFVLDVHLGKLARHLRLLGFDTACGGAVDDADIVRQSLAEARTILTRDRGLLKRAAVTHGYWVRATDPRAQLREVVDAFDLAGGAAPFTRCLQCNGALEHVAKADIVELLPPYVREHFDAFARCAGCSRVYWRGTHWERLRLIVDATLRPP